MATPTQRLEIKVAAVNLAHKTANEIYQPLVDYFRQFVGQKVVKDDGSLTKKVASGLPELPKGDGIHLIYKDSSSYSIRFSVRTCKSGYPDHTGYSTCCSCHEAGVTIGNLAGTILKDINETSPQYKCDYTVEDIQAKRERYKELAEQANQAKYALSPFGEYDH